MHEHHIARTLTSEEQHRRMLQTPVPKLVLSLAAPTVASQLISIIYNTAVAYPIGIAVAALFLGIFLYTIKKRHTQPHYETLGK